MQSPPIPFRLFGTLALVECWYEHDLAAHSRLFSLPNAAVRMLFHRELLQSEADFHASVVLQ